MVQLMLVFVLLLLGGCGSKDELVLITTEHKAGDNSETYEDEEKRQQSMAESDTALPADEDMVSTEEASETDRAVTMEAVYAANSGDSLLSKGKGCSVNTIYYLNGTEVYSEYRYLGFEENGGYVQAYEDSKGNVEVLDNYNQCWYVVENNRIYTKIYPEDGVTARLINHSHNNIVFSLEDAGQLQNIYREDGKLVLETVYSDAEEESEAGMETESETKTETETDMDIGYMYKYYVSDELFVDEIDCYDAEGERVSHAWVTRDAVYNAPEEILELLNGNAEQRTVNIEYPQGGGINNLYFVPVQYPVMLETMRYGMYEDAGCTMPWTGEMMEQGPYGDLTIYLRYSD